MKTGISEAQVEAAGPSAERALTTVLVVDDSAAARRAVGELLASHKDLKVAYARDGREGLAAIARDTPSVIITDLVMPDMEGLELIQEVRIERPHIPIILMTAFGSEDVAMRALRAGAANYIPKKYLARDLPRPSVMSWPSRAWVASAGESWARWSDAYRLSFSRTTRS